MVLRKGGDLGSAARELRLPLQGPAAILLPSHHLAVCGLIGKASSHQRSNTGGPPLSSYALLLFF